MADEAGGCYYDIETGIGTIECPHCRYSLSNPKELPLERGDCGQFFCDSCEGPVFLVVLPEIIVPDSRQCLKVLPLDKEILESDEFTDDDKDQYIWDEFQEFAEEQGIWRYYEELLRAAAKEGANSRLTEVDADLIEAISNMSAAPSDEELGLES